MKATGRSVWQNQQGKWLYQVYIPRPGHKAIKRIRQAESKLEALDRVEKLYFELKRQELVSKPKHVSELFANYMKLKAPFVGDSTLANNKYLAEKYLLPQFGHRLASKVSAIEVQMYLDGLRPALSTSTVHKLHSILSQIYKLAVDYGQIGANPIDKLPRLRPLKNEPTQVEKPWDAEEARATLSAVQGTMIDFALHATISYGLRKGEALGIRWSDIDFENGWLDVKRSRSSHRQLDAEGNIRTTNESGELKTKASKRRLHLNTLVLLSLMREKEMQSAKGFPINDDDYVARGAKGNPLSDTMLYRTYNQICQDSGLRRIRVHDHRHTAAVLALEAMVEPIVVSYGLGHSSFEITKRIYASIAPGLTQRFSTAVSDVLLLAQETALPVPLTGGTSHV